MATVLASQDRLVEGLRLAAESVQQCRDTLGERSIETSHALHTLATLQLDANHNHEAEKVAANALVAIEGVNGKSHISTVPIRSTLIEVLRRLERYQDADHLVQVSLEVVQQVLGERHPAAAHILVDRSVLRSALGDANGAGEALVAAVALMEASPEVFPEAYVRKHRAKLK